MRRWLQRLWLAWLGVALAAVATAAGAHEMTMAEMTLRETTRGEFIWLWAATNERSPTSELAPVWPAGCTADGNALHCGTQGKSAGLSGPLSINGVGKTYSAALVKITWQDGQTSVHTLTGGQPTVQLYGAADDRRGFGEVARAYLLLGVEHILGGYDHLLFVVGLLFLVGFQRRLVWTITAFTAAHSITLASAAMGWLTLRPPPVEACIALSIMLVASEALRERQTLAKRLPALVAFIFGLVHGLGFAGALQEIGLPQQHLAVALLTFNLGVEAGQLLTVAACWAVVRLLRQQAWAPRLKLPLVYGMGTVAAYWTWLRVVAIVA